jgi:thiol-disulfide isomerase/thioredoxin
MIKVILLIFTFFISCVDDPDKTGITKDELSVTPLNESRIDTILNENKGKVILVNLWATWCVPCKEEMPDLIKLNKDFNGKDFKLVLISLDEEEKIQAASDFLKENGAAFETYYNDFDKDENLMNFFDESWDGAIPATFIINKEGKIITGFIGKKDYETFYSEVIKLM